MYPADFHVHSRFSRATSKSMNLEELSQWARRKGIRCVGTGDFTHFLWFHELRGLLKATDREGIFTYGGVDFMLTSEICAIFDRQGRSKRIHLMVFASDLGRLEKLNQMLEHHGDLNVDGRPILHIEASDLVEVVKSADEKGFIVPAHVWTPHFSLFGSNSGFDTIEECFGSMTEEIPALETGLSSDPPMNRRVSALDRFSLISNSDAHSPDKLGREMNVFRGPFDVVGLKKILKERNTEEFLFTVEYFPEEGKYHYDGHRTCKYSCAPEESVKRNNLCPVCGRNVTVGVMHRVGDLADRTDGALLPGVPGFRKMVPLDQIIGAVLCAAPDSVGVRNKYLETVRKCGTEFAVLIELEDTDLFRLLDPVLAAAVRQVRNGEVRITPGYDGEFGKVEIINDHPQGADEQSLF